jgi:hypothetical protein
MKTIGMKEKDYRACCHSLYLLSLVPRHTSRKKAPLLKSVAHSLFRSNQTMVNTEVGTTYNTFAAGVFIFNLIVGVGVLALPAGFLSAGLVKKKKEREQLFSIISTL